jgi:peptidylprolyl isomerase
MRWLISLTTVGVLASALVACGDDDGDGANNLDATPTAVEQPTLPPSTPIPTVVGEPTVTDSGLQIIDIVVGEGAEALEGDTVTVHYTGYLENGQVFDSSVTRGQPAPFPLSRVILGWQEGVPGMKVGGQRRLIIPPELAYGEAGQQGIPPNATLTFDIELVSIP